MYKQRAKRRFKKYFLEALLRGVKAETASDEAMARTKAEMKSMFEVNDHIPDVKKDRMWFVMLDELVDWQIMLSDLPLDNPLSMAGIPKILERMQDPVNTIAGPGITEESRQSVDGTDGFDDSID